jgi:hypothetical protein
VSTPTTKNKPAGSTPAGSTDEALAKRLAEVLDFAAAYPEPGFVGELRAMGFRVMPLPAGAKKPPPTGYPTNGRDYVIPEGRNVAIDTGHFWDGGALLVLDVDKGPGKHGGESLRKLEAARGTLPRTLTTITPTGGKHLFFRVQNAVRTSAGALGKNLDVRSQSAYVVAPGSTVKAGTYRFEGQEHRPAGSVVAAGTFPPIADAPAWLVELCGQPRERSTEPFKPLEGYAAEVATEKARAYLVNDAPPAVEGDAGDHTAFSVAARVRDFGVSPEDCLELMLEHWNERCAPPWSPTELERKVRNAYEYAKGEAGADNPAVVFDPVEQSANAEPKEIGPGLRVQIVDATSVRPVPIRWLWPGWLARGKLHVIAGAPGTGKTTIALNLAACVSAGRAFPNGAKPAAGHVVIWSGEDGFDDTLRPRLAAAGADLARVHFVGDVQQDGKAAPFDPARHVPALACALAGLDNVAMIVVDPLVSAVSGDSHKNAEVRRGLAPLVDLATKLDAALLGITHYSKGTQGREPLERVSGSLAFGALARLVFGTVRQKTEGDETERRYMLLRVKSNIGPDGGGFGYTIGQCEAETGIEASRIEWGAAIEGNARDLLGEAEANTASDPAASDAAKFLREVLADGPKPVSEIKRLAAEEGHAWRTVGRARQRAGVAFDRKGSGQGHGTTWFLTASEYQKPAEIFGDR